MSVVYLDLKGWWGLEYVNTWHVVSLTGPTVDMPLASVQRIEIVYIKLIFIIVIMCYTEFIQIEAGLIKVSAGVQHSNCLMYVKCRRGSYKCLVNS